MNLDPSQAGPTLDAAQLRQAILANLTSRTTYRGEVTLSCLPAALEHHVQLLAELFGNLGKPLTDEEQSQLHQLVADTLEKGFRESADARLLIQYEITPSPTLQKNLSCSVAFTVPTLADQYRHWSQSHQSPLFGKHPDAKVLAVAAQLAPVATSPILDVGAGPGRNALPLARMGYPVEALEVTPEFVQQLQTTAQAEGLSITTIVGDLLDPLVRLRSHHYQLALLSEVVSHFRDTQQLRLMLAKLTDALRPGGLLLFNLFLPKEGYEPDPLARQMSQGAWSSLFTRSELAEALVDLPLELISDESALEYERENLPANAWPPTSWFEAWASGKSVFPLAHVAPPMELRWLLYRKL